MLILSQICNIYKLWKRSRATQVPLAGHMRPAGRVFETAGLGGMIIYSNHAIFSIENRDVQTYLYIYSLIE